jgi:hypothetical protein
VDCVAALAITGSGPPGFLCRILGRRRESRTKCELLLARLRRSWHIRLYWNSYGCRRHFRAAGPHHSKNPVPSEAARALPSLHRACHATSTFALFLPRLLLFRNVLRPTQDPCGFSRHCERSEAIHGPATSRSPISQRLVLPMPRSAEAADHATRGASASRECLVETRIASLRSQ